MADLTLHTGRSSPCLGFLSGAVDRAMLLLPFENVDSLLLDSVPCRQAVVGVYSGELELLLANPRPCSFAALALPFEAVDSLSGPPAGSKLFWPGSHELLQASPSAWNRARHIAWTAAETATAAPEIFASAQPRHALQDSLLHAVHELISADRSRRCARAAVPRRGGAL